MVLPVLPVNIEEKMKEVKKVPGHFEGEDVLKLW